MSLDDTKMPDLFVVAGDYHSPIEDRAHPGLVFAGMMGLGVVLAVAALTDVLPRWMVYVAIGVVVGSVPVAFALVIANAILRRELPRGVGELHLARALEADSSSGTVCVEQPVLAPLSGEECAAYAITVTCAGARGGPVMLREARSGRLIVESEAGRVLVPAGRVRLVAAHDRGKRFGRRTARRYRRTVGVWSSFDCDAAFELRVNWGERVTVLGDLKPLAEEASYRQSGVQTVRGVPCLVLGDRDDAPSR